MANVVRSGRSAMVTGISVGTAVITAEDEDGAKATCNVTVTAATKNYTVVEGQTLVHYKPKLIEFSYFGVHLGTENSDGSYTFDGSAGSWSGGGAQYDFPRPKSSDTWTIDDYLFVEMHLKVTDGSVTVGVKKPGGNTDLKPIPDDSNSITFNTTTNEGVFIYKTVIGEAGQGIGFQRNTGGPATVAIEKVVFTKGTTCTITFTGGDYTAMPTIAPISIPEGRTVNFFGSYSMPKKPKWTDHTFAGWFNQTDSVAFNDTAPITKSITLNATWTDGAPPPVDMRLNLDKSTWPTPLPTNAALTGGGASYVIPSEYAASTYDSTTQKLTLEYAGLNRQRAIIPLSADQIDELMDATGGVTFRIDATVTRGEPGTLADDQIGTGLQFAGFRLHLGSPSASSSWNGTNTGMQTPLTGNPVVDGKSQDHLYEYCAFSGSKSAATLGYFIIQAMFRNASGNPDALPSAKPVDSATFPKVTIVINSILVEAGDTRSPEEIEKQNTTKD